MTKVALSLKSSLMPSVKDARRKIPKNLARLEASMQTTMESLTPESSVLLCRALA